MAAYFPKSYPDELLYSVIARYSVHAGIVSPKKLLDEVFGNRTVIAVVDLPSHLASIKRVLGDYWTMEPQETIYKLTLFPLYAPFVPEIRRQDVIAKMMGDNGGSIHTELGVAASSVKVPVMLRYCPACLIDYRKSVGEYFWRRLFQITGVDYCTVHCCRLDLTNVFFHNARRHEFIAATPRNCHELTGDSKAIDFDRKDFERTAVLLNMIQSILDLPAAISPTYHQWSHFYRQLAFSTAACTGNRIDHQIIAQKMISAWSNNWLVEHGCQIAEQEQSSWLRDIFRKHRKSYSYLRHAMIWATFAPSRTVQNIMDEVKSFPSTKQIGTQNKIPNCIEDKDEIAAYRNQWLDLLQKTNAAVAGVRAIRNRPNAAAIYAWLYRHDKAWLLAINEKYYRRPQKAACRVNWSQRDWWAARRVINIAKQSAEDLTLPRKTKNWFLNRVERKVCRIETISKLPITQALLCRYEETLLEYQIRRCTVSVIRLIENHQPIERWRIERMAGFRRDKESTELKYFLQWIEDLCSEQGAFQANSRFVEVNFFRKSLSKR